MRCFILLLFVVLFCLPSYAQPPLSSQGTGNQQDNHVRTDTTRDSQTDQTKTSQPPPTNIKVSTPQAGQESTVKQTESGKKLTKNWSLSDKIAAIASIVAFLQFVALIVTIGDSRRSSRRQLRAYVSGRPDFITSFDETHWPIVKTTIQNFGQTPAYDLIHRSRIEVFPYPLPKNFTLPNIDIEWTAPIVLFPNLPVIGQTGRGILFTNTELADLRNRTKRLYVFGEIKYRDVFRRRCWSSFCISITAKDDGIWQKLTTNNNEIFPGTEITYETAPIGNDADHR